MIIRDYELNDFEVSAVPTLPWRFTLRNTRALLILSSLSETVNYYCKPRRHSAGNKRTIIIISVYIHIYYNIMSVRWARNRLRWRILRTTREVSLDQGPAPWPLTHRHALYILQAVCVEQRKTQWRHNSVSFKNGIFTLTDNGPGSFNFLMVFFF